MSRDSITEMLKEEFGVFEYKGHGSNIGVWVTDDFQALTKPFGDSFCRAKFRLCAYLPNQYGNQIKIEIFLPSVCEWETIFEGYIYSVSDISKLLNYHFGLKKVKER